MKKKILFCITFFIIGIILEFKYLDKHVNLNIDDKYTSMILEKVFLNKEEEKVKEINPTIYLYNTHDTEEYKSNNLFSFNPNVTMIKYILKNELEKNNYKVLIEERSIKDLLNINNWSYNYSYKASRIYMDEISNQYNSIKYYIDIHRDSLEHDKTTITIDNKDYAKLIFLIGLENPNYQDNLYFTEKINNKLNEYYPNLSKGIYKKGGPGVNGVYNQDKSPYAILVEFGGYENTTYEVLNSILAFSKCYIEVLNEG